MEEGKDGAEMRKDEGGRPACDEMEKRRSLVASVGEHKMQFRARPLNSS